MDIASRIRPLQPRLCLVVPCYNEANVLPITAPLFVSKLRDLVAREVIRPDSSVLFVDDGSSDKTWEIIAHLSQTEPECEGLKLSRNQGHQAALLAGLMEARKHYDAAVSMDCDGQDDIDAVDAMLDAYLEGCEVVYGVRSDRASDTSFKRGTAQLFYRMLNALGAETVYNHADYRLMSARALDALSEFDEVNLYLRGLVPLVGFKSTTVEYARSERMAGESHYPLHKMATLAANGITSLSIRPIHFIAVAGLALSALSLLAILVVIVLQLTGNTVTGWASMLCVMLLIGGLQLVALGIIGEYVGRIYLETKRRPRYIIEECTL